MVSYSSPESKTKCSCDPLLYSFAVPDGKCSGCSQLTVVQHAVCHLSWQFLAVLLRLCIS